MYYSQKKKRSFPAALSRLVETNSSTGPIRKGGPDVVQRNGGPIKRY
jgi:hypothetical protein